MILTLILITLWIALCFSCTVLGLLLGLKARQERMLEEKPISEAEKRRIEKERRELKNFMSYTGDSQTP